MKNDMDGFKRVASDKNTMTLRHPKGHEIRVATNALSKAMRDKVMALPQHFEDGGMVDSNDDQDLTSPASTQPLAQYGQLPQISAQDLEQPASASDDLLNTINAPQNVPVEAPPVSQQPIAPVDHSQEIHQASTPFGARIVDPHAVPAQPMNVAPTAASAVAPSAPVVAGPDGLKTLMSGIGQEKAGMAMEAKAVGELGMQKAKHLNDEAVANDAAITAYQDNDKRIAQTIDDYAEDIKNRHFNPDRYMASLSTGGKISTAIGLILGGIGGGILHQENAALKQLNTLIDRDIEGQKQEMGQKDNLLKANLLKFGNMNDAIKVTRMMMNTSTSLKMQADEAAAQDPLAKARLMQARGKLDQQTYSLVDQMSRQKALLAAAGSTGHDGQLSSMDPSRLVSMIPAHDQKQAREELQKAAEIKQIAERAMANWDVVNEATTKGYALKHPMRAFSGAQSNQLGADIADLNVKVTHRFNPEENKVLKKQFETTFADGPEDRKLKRASFESWVSGGRHFPTLSQYNIDPNKFQSTALQLPASPMEQGQQLNKQQHAQWSQWAQKYPNDPLAKKYMLKMQGGK